MTTLFKSKTYIKRILDDGDLIHFYYIIGLTPIKSLHFITKEMGISTPPDYDEMHYKMLKCYFIQPLSKGTLVE